MSIGVHELEHGIMHVTWPSTTDQAALDAFFAEADAQTSGGAPYVVLYECASIPRVPAPQRKAFKAWLTRNRPLHEAYCRGVAYVTPSPLVRGVVASIFHIVGAPYPHRGFERRDDALTWLRQELRRA